MEGLLSSDHKITERVHMKYQPFGINDEGKKTEDVRGHVITSMLGYVREIVKRREEESNINAPSDVIKKMGEKAAQDAAAKFVSMLNGTIKDRTYWVTEQSLDNPWNSYSTEFFHFAAEFAKELTGEKDFCFKLGLNKLIRPILAIIVRPVPLEHIYRLVAVEDRFAKGSVEIQVPSSTENSAVVRIKVSDKYRKNCGEYFMACAENTCQIRKGVLVAIPEKIHKLPSAALRDIKCLANGDEYCEVELTWVQKPQYGRGFLLLGISTSAVLFICLTSFLEDMAIISAISILPLLVSFHLSKIERLFKENENKDKLIVEQQGYIEERFKELEESNIQLQTTNIELSNSIDKEVKIRKFFERYVPEKVVSEVLQRSDEYLFTGENRRASILFLDVRHFTALAEKHKPEDVVDVLNKLFSEVSKTIINRGGIVDKFVGDGVLAVFGAPASLDDHALCAVSAAIEIKESLEEFNCWLKDKLDESIIIGISINSGEIISGNVGSIEKMEYTVVGGPVNKTFRIQDFTKEKPNSILIGKDTYSEVKDKVKVVSWGIKNLRGSSESIELFEVLGHEHNV